MSDKYELSRRKALAALGTIGVAGAGAGMGTSALYGDSETAENNSITAGRLNLEVEVELEDINPETQNLGLDAGASDLDEVGETVTIDGDQSSGIDGGETADFDLVFDDVKPGDWWVLKTCLKVEGNPAYVGVRSKNISQSEGPNPEPEPSTPTPDLGQKLRVRIGNRYDDTASAGIQEGTASRKDVQQGWLGPSDSEKNGNNTPATVDYTPPKDISLPNDDGGIRFGDNGFDDSPVGNDDGVLPEAANPLDLYFVGTLNHRLWAILGDLGQSYNDPEVGDGDPTTGDIENLTYADYSTFVNPKAEGNDEPGVGYDGPGVGPGFGSIRNSNDYTTVGTENSPDTQEICTYTKYFIPREVGNEIMGDSISFSLEYKAEQARNNDQPSWL